MDLRPPRRRSVKLLLPPSETKRHGGDPASALDLGRLSFPALTPSRRVALRELRALSRNLTTMTTALRLGPTQRGEVLRNREVTTSPTMPALDRFTGVLYDALDAPSLDAGGRASAARFLVIHSALFGLVGADDRIPAYRLSHDSRLPTVRLRELWNLVLTAELAAMPGLVLDLRSEAYAALGPTPPRSERHVVVRVVIDAPDGVSRPLNHFNKSAKGMFARAVVDAGIDHPDVGSLLEWSAAAGIGLRRTGESALELPVDR